MTDKRIEDGPEYLLNAIEAILWELVSTSEVEDPMLTEAAFKTTHLLDILFRNKASTLARICGTILGWMKKIG